MIAFAVGGTVGPKIALAGMYLFGIFYSFGEGSVPFVYAAEAAPLYCRESAVAFIVAINWLFNWVIAFSGPWMFRGLEPVGTFAFYGSMCVLLWFMILFFVPETRLLRLEEIDHIFDKVKTRDFGHHALHTLLWFVRGQKDRPDPLYQVMEERREEVVVEEEEVEEEDKDWTSATVTEVLHGRDSSPSHVGDASGGHLRPPYHGSRPAAMDTVNEV